MEALLKSMYKILMHNLCIRIKNTVHKVPAAPVDIAEVTVVVDTVVVDTAVADIVAADIIFKRPIAF